MDAKSFVLALVFLLAGLWLGYHLEQQGKGNVPLFIKKAVAKPAETRVLGGCTNEMGIRQARSSDLPLGPIYLTYEGKTVGVEYQLSKEDIDAGKLWSMIPLRDATYTLMDLVWQSGGDDGLAKPHYDLRLFTVTPEEKRLIRC